MGSDDYKAMSREEQLQQTAEEWADYYKHAEDLCDYISIRVAYKEGAAWADEHPVDVWHDVSEEPRHNELMLGIDSDGVSLYKWCEQEDSWGSFAAITELSSWAYISDLLPKGGKE